MDSNPFSLANPILSRHRQWLESFKERMREKRTIQELQAEQDKEKFKRIREKAEVNKSRAQEVNSDAPEYSPQQEQPSPVRVIN